MEEESATTEKRIKVLENRVNEVKQVALAKKKAGDQKNAVMQLKKMKMYEK